MRKITVTRLLQSYCKCLKNGYNMFVSKDRSQQLTNTIFFHDKITRKVYKEQNTSAMIGKVYKMNEALSKFFFVGIHSWKYVVALGEMSLSILRKMHNSHKNIHRFHIKIIYIFDMKLHFGKNKEGTQLSNAPTTATKYCDVMAESWNSGTRSGDHC